MDCCVITGAGGHHSPTGRDEGNGKKVITIFKRMASVSAHCGCFTQEGMSQSALHSPHSVALASPALRGSGQPRYLFSKQKHPAKKLTAILTTL